MLQVKSSTGKDDAYLPSAKPKSLDFSNEGSAHNESIVGVRRRPTKSIELVYDENRGTVSAKGVKAKHRGIGKAKVFTKFTGRILGVPLIQGNGKADNPISAKLSLKLEEYPTFSGACRPVDNHDTIRFHHLTDFAGLFTGDQLPANEFWLKPLDKLTSPFLDCGSNSRVVGKLLGMEPESIQASAKIVSVNRLSQLVVRKIRQCRDHGIWNSGELHPGPRPQFVARTLIVEETVEVRPTEIVKGTFSIRGTPNIEFERLAELPKGGPPIFANRLNLMPVEIFGLPVGIASALANIRDLGSRKAGYESELVALFTIQLQLHVGENTPVPKIGNGPEFSTCVAGLTLLSLADAILSFYPEVHPSLVVSDTFDRDRPNVLKCETQQLSDNPPTLKSVAELVSVATRFKRHQPDLLRLR